MKRAIVFLNGEYGYSQDFIDRLVDSDSDCYCADGGANHIFRYGKTPRLIAGDLDSIRHGVLSYFTEKNAAVEKFPPEKDFTDFELILQKIGDFEKENGKYEKIFVLGGIGGRVDMTLNNLHLLESFQNLVFLSSYRDRIEEVFYTEKPLVIKNRKSCIFSIISLDEAIQKLSLRGFKYELENTDTERKFSRLVSNEIVSDCCSVEFAKGKILICISSREKNFSV